MPQRPGTLFEKLDALGPQCCGHQQQAQAYLKGEPYTVPGAGIIRSDAAPASNAGKLSMRSPMVKGWRPLLAVLAGCLALGAIPGLIQLLFAGISLHIFGISVLHGVVYAGCIGMPCWIAMPAVLCRIEKGSAPARSSQSLDCLECSALSGALSQICC